MQIEVQKTRAERPISASRLRERGLAERATAQHVVTRGQLLELGFSADQVNRMRYCGRLRVIHRAVYAVGHGALAQRAYWLAAVLACGPGALLSHRCAAALAQVRRTSLAYVEVTVRARRAPLDGVRQYVNRRIAPQDRRDIDGIPCTSIALTLLGLAAVAPRRAVERACGESVVQQLFDLAAIEELIERSRGARGVANLSAVVRAHATAAPTLTRSELEERALALLRRAGIASPEVNVRVVCRPGVAHEVDFLWRSRRVVLETDGHRFHSTTSQIERDRRKEADLVRAGHRVLRATWRQIEREPRDVALMVAAALEGY